MAYCARCKKIVDAADEISEPNYKMDKVECERCGEEIV